MPCWPGPGSGSVRFATDETAATTFAMLAECFEVLGGVPRVVLADRMGCLKGGVVANVVIPTPDYVRFATHYRFRPDFCEGHDPESKGMVEHLVGYAKRDLMIPQAPFTDLAAANQAAATWCTEVNAVTHSEIFAVPAERLVAERELLGVLPGLRLEIGPRPITRDAHYWGRDAIGMPGPTIHGLRLTSATMAAQQGATLAELQARIGHTTPDMALLYQHVVGDRDARLAARISAMAVESGNA